jgi:hypothetical protein
MITPILSILIPATPARYHSHLWPLYEKLAAQVTALDLVQPQGSARVELLVFLDNRQRTIGEKRDALVQMSRGKFVAFCDDDDDVAPNYISAIVAAIAANPHVDVITFKQRVLVDGVEGICHFSLQHQNEPFRAGTFHRNAWHVCAWRGELARRYRFPAINYGEDWSWAKHLVMEAAGEYHIDEILHVYRYDRNVSEAPAPATAGPIQPVTCYEDIPGWFDYEDLYAGVVGAARDGATFVELGTYMAKSAAFMMLKIRESGKSIRFDSYDIYCMAPGAEDEKAMIDHHGSLEQAARACFKDCTGLDSERFLHNKDSALAAELYDDGTVDFCFIDADHSEAAVKSDIAAWLPKIRAGGVIAGHDFDFPEVRSAVQSFFGMEQLRIVGRCWLVVVPSVDTPK